MRGKGILTCLLVLVLCLSGTVTAYSASELVTYEDNTYSYYSDGTKPELNIHALFKGERNRPIYSGTHGISAPMGSIGNAVYLDKRECTNTMVRKILYYGYGGPKQWNGFDDPTYNGPYNHPGKNRQCGNAVVSMALTKTMATKGTWFNVSGLDEFLAYCQSQEEPPTNFITYEMPSGTSTTQDLYTWDWFELSTEKDRLMADEKQGYGTENNKAVNEESKTAADSSKAPLGDTAVSAEGKNDINQWNSPEEKFANKQPKLSEDVKNESSPKDNDKKASNKLDRGSVFIEWNLKEYNFLPSILYDIKGAVYSIYNAYGQEVGTLTLGEDGRSNKVGELPLGDYYIKATKVPAGYLLDKKKYSFKISNHGNGHLHQHIQIQCKPAYSNELKLLREKALLDNKAPIYSYKNKNDSLSLKDAVFKISYYDKYINEVENQHPYRVWYVKTDEKGIGILDENHIVGGEPAIKVDGKVAALLGTYCIEEVKAPNGMAKSNGKVIRQLKQEKEGEPPIYNTPVLEKGYLPSTLEVVRQDKISEGRPVGEGSLSGALYQVWYIDGKLKDGKEVLAGTIVTDSNGNGQLSGLKVGTYKIKEITPSPGYERDDETYVVTVNPEKIQNGGFKATVHCMARPTTLTIKCLNRSLRENVVGALLVLTDSRGKEIRRWTSGINPEMIYGLSFGDYFITEIKSPLGYSAMEKRRVISVKNNSTEAIFRYRKVSSSKVIGAIKKGDESVLAVANEHANKLAVQPRNRPSYETARAGIAEYTATTTSKEPAATVVGPKESVSEPKTTASNEEITSKEKDTAREPVTRSVHHKDTAESKELGKVTAVSKDPVVAVTAVSKEPVVVTATTTLKEPVETAAGSKESVAEAKTTAPKEEITSKEKDAATKPKLPSASKSVARPRATTTSNLVVRSSAASMPKTVTRTSSVIKAMSLNAENTKDDKTKHRHNILKNNKGKINPHKADNQPKHNVKRAKRDGDISNLEVKNGTVRKEVAKVDPKDADTKGEVRDQKKNNKHNSKSQHKALTKTDTGDRNNVSIFLVEGALAVALVWLITLKKIKINNGERHIK